MKLRNREQVKGSQAARVTARVGFAAVLFASGVAVAQQAPDQGFFSHLFHSAQQNAQPALEQAQALAQAEAAKLQAAEAKEAPLIKAEFEKQKAWIAQGVASLLDKTKHSQQFDPNTISPEHPRGEPRWNDELLPEEQVLLTALQTSENFVTSRLVAYGRVMDRVHLDKRPFDQTLTLLSAGIKDAKGIVTSATEGDVVPGSFHMTKVSQKELAKFSASQLQDMGFYVRYGLEVSFKLGHAGKGESYSENLWVHYLPILPEGAQPTLELLDANGNEVKPVPNAEGVIPDETIAKVVHVRVLRDGLSGWPSLEENDGVETVLPDETAMFKNMTVDPKRHVAANVRSSQGLRGGQMFSADCENFIEPDGSYGPWGQYLYTHLDPNNVDWTLFNAPPTDISSTARGSVCPKYNSFNDDQKKNFWVWFAASIAQEESGCNPESHTRGTYGIASGLWQLDLGRTSLYCGGICGKIDTMVPTLNVTCGENMLNWYTKEAADSKRIVYWHGNYWQTMHPPQLGWKRGVKALSTFAACH